MGYVAYESVLSMPPDRLFELHTRPEALRRLSPGFPPVREIEQSGGFEVGTTIRIRVGVGPLSMTWLAFLEEVVPGRMFVDVQKEGPFRSWRHVHSFLPSDKGCLMRDEVEWVPKLGFPGLDAVIVRPALRSYFRKRHAALAQWVSEEQQQPGATREKEANK